MKSCNVTKYRCEQTALKLACFRDMGGVTVCVWVWVCVQVHVCGGVSERHVGVRSRVGGSPVSKLHGGENSQIELVWVGKGVGCAVCEIAIRCACIVGWMCVCNCLRGTGVCVCVCVKVCLGNGELCMWEGHLCGGHIERGSTMETPVFILERWYDKAGLWFATPKRCVHLIHVDSLSFLQPHNLGYWGVGDSVKDVVHLGELSWVFARIECTWCVPCASTIVVCIALPEGWVEWPYTLQVWSSNALHKWPLSWTFVQSPMWEIPCATVPGDVTYDIMDWSYLLESVRFSWLANSAGSDLPFLWFSLEFVPPNGFIGPLGKGPSSRGPFAQVLHPSGVSSGVAHFSF